MQQLGYRLNLKTKVCEKFKLTEPFREIGVPLGARLDGEVEIGTAAIPGAGVLTQIYEADTPRGVCCLIMSLSGDVVTQGSTLGSGSPSIIHVCRSVIPTLIELTA